MNQPPEILSSSRLNDRRQAFTLLALLKEGDRAVALLDCFSEGRMEGVGEAMEQWEKFPKKTRDSELTAALERLKTSALNLWTMADPGWLVETLRGESALVWALFIQELPRGKVGRVLSELPKELRRRIKSLSQLTPALPVWKWLQTKVGSRFPNVPSGAFESNVEWEALINLSPEAFMQLMRELGLSEMAIAFSKINKTATRAILHRLSVEDAKDLKRRIKQGETYNPELTREAQMSILSLEVEKLKTEELTQEIGFGVFSRALSSESAELAPLFVYKLPPRYGYILKRHLDLNLYRNNPEKARRVLERIKQSAGTLFQA
ncbi:MAG TPA: hypothetical protein DF383_00015 [Deltaproteobacteria bacterium]|nr:hypothetical protein [Deltaproteobacteria bacterium]